MDTSQRNQERSNAYSRYASQPSPVPQTTRRFAGDRPPLWLRALLWVWPNPRRPSTRTTVDGYARHANRPDPY